MNQQRFTIDGTPELEARLARACDQVLAGVEQIVSGEHLEALVLGGGYGRGQGGVWITPAGDRPYNDLEFYVFVRGNLLLNVSRFAQQLNRLGERLSLWAGLHVEFKIDSLSQLRRRSISMFSYDLVAAHRMIYGSERIFRGCEHHLQPERLPLFEATRLLFNRLSGLLLARKHLKHETLDEVAADFVRRNLAKAQLALGDAVLTAGGRYHWDCRERNRRLTAPREVFDNVPHLAEIRAHHVAGVQFKLHPYRCTKPPDVLRREHRGLCGLAAKLWLWIENQRLQSNFESPADYAVSAVNKCPGSPRWKNYLLNFRTLGANALLDTASARYPRNRLLNCLPLLLWNGELSDEPELLRHVQKQLHSRGSEWNELVNAYQRIWSIYG